MDREAKIQQKKIDLINYILEDYDWADFIPKCDCPIDEFDDKMPITFCSTQCETICWRYRRFDFVSGDCKKMQCSTDNPCAECLDKIEDSKDMINKFKAIFYNYNQDVSANKKAKLFCDLTTLGKK